MNNDDFLLLSAYLDNELSPDERVSVEERLAKDNEFAELFSDLEKIDDAIELHSTELAAEIDNKPIPSEITELLKPTVNKNDSLENVKTLSESSLGTASRPSKTFRQYLPIAAAVATIAIAIPLYMQLSAEKTNEMTLSQALNALPSGQQQVIQNDSVVSISMTFESADGNICREYVLAESLDSTAGQQIISCRANSDWQQVLSANVTFSKQGQFQPASGQTSRDVEAWLDTNMASDAYSLEKERLILSSRQ